MRLKDKVAIVTGSTKGIGYGIAQTFLEEGAKVAIVSRHAGEGEKVADQLGRAEGKTIYVQTDVTDVDSVKNLIETTVKAFGKLDILVNNAGYHGSQGIEDLTDADFDNILKTNLYSTYYCSKYALPHLKKTKGNIIHISSMVGLVGQPNACAYTATKGGQIAMAKNMAIDLAKYGIRVNAICPGWIDTPLVDDWFASQKDPEASKKYIYEKHPLGRIGTGKDCGESAVFLASDEMAGFITGSVITLDGGITLGY